MQRVSDCPVGATPQKCCTKCKRSFPATRDNFHQQKKGKHGVTSQCKECTAKRQHEYFLNNRERRYARDAAWRKNNPEKFLTRKRERERNRKQQPKYRNYLNVKYHKREARKRLLDSSYTDQDWNRCLICFSNRCAVCGRPQGLWHKLAQDHWIPISKGGGYTPRNIIPLCHGEGGCNNSKCNRDAAEWLTEKLGKRKAKAKLAEIEAYFASLD